MVAPAASEAVARAGLCEALNALKRCEALNALKREETCNEDEDRFRIRCRCLRSDASNWTQHARSSGGPRKLFASLHGNCRVQRLRGKSGHSLWGRPPFGSPHRSPDIPPPQLLSRNIARACAKPGSDNPLNSATQDRKSTRLNSSHLGISYAVFF